jgi:hypothetical protein
MTRTKQLWQRAAAGYLAAEVIALRTTRPLQQPCIVRWRGDLRIGGIAELRADGVCMLALTSRAMPPGFVDELKRLSPARLEYVADAELDLAGRQHVIARDGNRVRRLAPAQTRWAAEHISSVYEDGARLIIEPSPGCAR